MAPSEIRLWPGVPDLRALGAREFEDLMGASGALEGEGAGELVCRSAARSVLRYPLPGTVTRAGERPERPRGAGTGFVYLTRWGGGSLGERAAARLTAPRSTSFAARSWNLLCHLREHGVGTAEPLAMGEERAIFFARRSFLATRALDRMEPLPAALERRSGPDERRHLATALGLFLGRILEARVELPHLGLDAIFVSRPAAGCGGNAPALPGHERSPLPELALASVRGGRILDAADEGAAARLMERLAAHLPSLPDASPRELLRVLRHSLGRLPRERRRALMRRLSPEPRPR